MSFIEMVEAIAVKTGLPKTTVSKVLKAFLGSAKEVLEAGDSIKLPGFGVFEIKQTTPRPLFGGTRVSEARSTVRFRQSRRRRDGEARRSVR